MYTINLTLDDFRENIFDYTKGNEWDYKGEKPAIIDFYADWCGPCKMIAPILEELSEEYKEKVVIYKVDTEKEQELSAMFRVRNIPSLLFIPQNGQPKMLAGALDKKGFIDVMNKELFS